MCTPHAIQLAPLLHANCPHIAVGAISQSKAFQQSCSRHIVSCCYECCHNGRSPEYWPCCYGLQLAAEFLSSMFTRSCFVANLVYPNRKAGIFRDVPCNWYLLALPVVQCVYELPFKLQTWSCPQAQQRKLALVESKRLAKTAEAIGMHVMGLNSKSTTEQLTSLLQQADIVSVHCPLTPKTHHLLG